MKGVWTESAKQARLILKKSYLPDPEILEICGQINREEYT